MTQKIDPFIQLNWGWDTGEGGWGEGMNNNLIIYSFLQNKRIDSVIASTSLLPTSPTDGSAYFTTSDKTIYLRADSVWYTFQPTVGMTFILKATESVVKFNGTTLVTDTKEISEINGLTSALSAKVSTSSIGAASGVAPLGVDGKVPAGNLPSSGSYLGTWDATTNTPTITSGVGSNGEFYIVAVAGTVSINGTGTWSAGDQIRFNGTIWQRIPNTSAISSVNGYTGTVVLNNTDVGAAASSHIHSNATTSVAGFMSDVDKTKLNGIDTGATANSADAYLLSRTNHTGTQAQSTITNLVSDLAAKQDTLVNTLNIKSLNGISLLGSGNVTLSTGGSTTFTGLTDTPASYTGGASKFVRVNSGETAVEFVAVGTAAFNNSTDFAGSSHTHADATTGLSGFMSAADKTKLNGVTTGATANSSDVTLLSRTNHTGTQLSSTISDFNTAADARVVAGITGKEGAIVAGTTTQYWRGDKSWQTLDKTTVGLSNVDNTSDVTKNSASVVLTNKTISGVANTLTNISQGSVTSLTSDLSAKAPLASPSFTGTVTLPLTTSIGSVGGTEISYLAGVSSSIQTQLNSKQASLGYTPVNSAGGTISGSLFISSGAASIPLSLNTTNALGTLQGLISGANSGYMKWDGSSIGFLSPDTTKSISVSNTGVSANCTITIPTLSITGSSVAAVVNLNTSNSFGAIQTSIAGTTTGLFKWDSTTTAMSSADLTKVLYVSNTGAGTTSNFSIGGIFSGDGSSITNLNASNLSTGTVATAVLPAASTTASGIAQLSNSVTTTSSTLSATSTAVKTAYDLAATKTTNQTDAYLLSRTNHTGTQAAGTITGLAAIATSGSASDLSTGTVANARLPTSSTTQSGIVQLDDSTSSASTSTAATSNAVRSAYIIASNADTKANAAVTKATPSQSFQSLGTVSGSVTVSAGSGTHVLATVNANTTWTFPTPSSTEAMAVTLELTNGGAYTMTWPSGTRWAGGVSPTLTASGTDILVFTKAGTNAWRGYLSSKDNK